VIHLLSCAQHWQALGNAAQPAIIGSVRVAELYIRQPREHVADFIIDHGCENCRQRAIIILKPYPWVPG